MEYLIYRNNPLNQFVQIRLHILCKQGEEIFLQLPSWRPGRYEITNYAQKIRSFSVSKDSENIPWKKKTKDLWLFTAETLGTYTIDYEFHASQMDAGGSWSDDEQLYLNFINCCFELKGREDEAITLQLILPDDYKAVTALPCTSKNHFRANNFQHLVDSPLMASNSIKHYGYQIGGSYFHLWFQGEIHFDIYGLIEKFKLFTEKQIQAFGEFPAEDYHFLYQLLPYKHYHGVEHQFSTVITIGPADTLGQKENLDELFGVSSHELYHVWNVCRIRPKELQPYDFSKEAYIDTGVVAEGVTTYMGDIFLLKSGYFRLEEYLSNMEKQIEREFESFGWQNQSISESSWDLWLDGYKTGIPEKKVSIYNRGALISLCLDLMLIDQGSSLHEVMKTMWERFGINEKGYSLSHYKQAIIDHHNDRSEIIEFFDQYIQGRKDIFPLLKKLLASINIRIESAPHPGLLDTNWGIKTAPDGTILKIHPQCPSYKLLMQGDKISEIDKNSFGNIKQLGNRALSVKLNRFGRILHLHIPSSEQSYYQKFNLLSGENNSKRNKWMS